MRTKKFRAVLGAVVVLALGVAAYGCSTHKEDDSAAAAAARAEESADKAAKAAAYAAGSAGVGAHAASKGGSLVMYQRGRTAQSPLGHDGGAGSGNSDLPRIAPGEELWVIADDRSERDDASEREGVRLERVGGSEPAPPLPLAHTDVKAQVTGALASVQVTQSYHNPYSEKIEAVYVFPLPENAAVKEFVMKVGARRIRAIVRERKDAERIYAEAKHQGYTASLLTEERPNIFRQSVANIEPGKAIDIEISYFHPVRYDGGEFEFVFPMVVGPRYNPPGTTNGVGAQGYGHPGQTGQATEVQYVPDGETTGHKISLSVDLDAGLPLASVSSPSHAIAVDNLSESHRRVALSPMDRIPNKDFRLRYRVAGDGVASSLVTHVDDRGGFFSLLLVPPTSLADIPAAAMEMVFVIDCSGSMSGIPLDLAKATIERSLRRLRPEDTFQIIRFSDSSSSLGPVPIAATPSNVELALRYLENLRSEGGTDMLDGIRVALDFPADPSRQRVISFLTDGFIGNDTEILEVIHQRIGSARIFSFGVGSSPNRYLLENMARIGRGAAAFVGLNEGTLAAVEAFYESVAHPALTGIELQWHGGGVSDVFPKRIPDLFAGRPIVVSGRFKPGANLAASMTGRVGSEKRVFAITPEHAKHSAVADIWARAYIAQLEDEEIAGKSRKTQITAAGLRYGLASPYTAFVAVDASARTAGSHGVTVHQPVPVPAGTRYDTSVGGGS